MSAGVFPEKGASWHELTSALDEHHHRQLHACSRIRRAPYIGVQAIFVPKAIGRFEDTQANGAELSTVSSHPPTSARKSDSRLWLFDPFLHSLEPPVFSIEGHLWEDAHSAFPGTG